MERFDYVILIKILSSLLYFIRVIISFIIITKTEKLEYDTFDFSFEAIPEKFSLMLRSYFGFFFVNEESDKLKRLNNIMTYFWIVIFFITLYLEYKPHS